MQQTGTVGVWQPATHTCRRTCAIADVPVLWHCALHIEMAAQTVDGVKLRGFAVYHTFALAGLAVTVGDHCAQGVLTGLRGRQRCVVGS